MTAPTANAQQDTPLHPIEDALREIALGRPVVVVDDENRENEGDLILAASSATQQWLAFLVRHTSGLICAPLTGQRLDELRLPAMTTSNEDPKGTAYTVTVDARDGVTTGISAADRARTIRHLADVTLGEEAFTRPGHVLPLRAAAGGVLSRPGHTEAAIDLTRLAGVPPASAIAEVVNDDGTMARLADLTRFAEHHGLVLVSIADLIDYRRHLGESPPHTARSHGAARSHDRAPERDQYATDLAAPEPASAADVPALTRARPVRVVETQLPTRYGDFTAVGYRTADQTELIALVAGPMSGPPLGGQLADDLDVPVRLHSECLTGDILGSTRCDCGPQLAASLEKIASLGRGVLLYLRGHEGRGIGLLRKLQAYHLQDSGRDTVDANLDLGLPADARDYRDAAAILTDLGAHSLRLLTNNPAKSAALAHHGLLVQRREPVEVPPGAHNLRYLLTKRDRMGHDLPWLPEPSTADPPAEASRSGPTGEQHDQARNGDPHR